MVASEYKGKRNMPYYLPATVEFLASLREINYEEFADVVYKNTLTLFNISDDAI